MPKRTDLKRILVIGSGPIVIGQGCEFDYAGVQACRALKEEGYHVILINSNPATVMTDLDICDSTYIEPICSDCIEKIIALEKPDALLPTMGGQTALNCAIELVKKGILEKNGVELLAASIAAIEKSENRQYFRAAMQKIGLEVPHSVVVHSVDEAMLFLPSLQFPVVLRTSFTLGGGGGSVSFNEDEFTHFCAQAFSMGSGPVLIEEYLAGWKEFEMEVIRDAKDNCIVVCSIENIDPMGIHTGDSVTVAPAQTLTDKEFQKMRSAAIAVLREIGVNTGGANVQFAVDPRTGRQVVIEMNPRVSRSSALASKATGYPIAKIAAKLAIGYTLDELKNDITKGQIPAAFEPTMDYVAVKLPRFDFDKFKGGDTGLTIQMKSIGEVMALGRTFQEALQKALSGLETGLTGLESPKRRSQIDVALRYPKEDRLLWVAEALRNGIDIEQIFQWTSIDRWFIAQIAEIVSMEESINKLSIHGLTQEQMRALKRRGFSDARLAQLLNRSEKDIRQMRHKWNIHPAYKRVDSCSGEFNANTAYLYASYEPYCESEVSDKKKIIILGSGPNRIGQGIEFDYCCVHAVLAVQSLGYEAIMVNCNPETVSTDYDLADRLYFESPTLETVSEILRLERPHGVIIQYGGQTALKLAKALNAMAVPILGTAYDTIDCVEDRVRFQERIQFLGLLCPPNATVYSVEEGCEAGERLGYPLVVRPSYVLGGKGVRRIANKTALRSYLTATFLVSHNHPVLLEAFLNNAIEVDVDAVSDGERVFIGGILEHIELAGIHSGDSACCYPAFSLSQKMIQQIEQKTEILAKSLHIIGPMNIQFAVQKDKLYILEVNPRISRTFPFISKAIGRSLAKMGVLCMLGVKLDAQTSNVPSKTSYFFIKQPVFSFDKIPGCDTQLGTEMKSTGEVMGFDETFESAYLKSCHAAKHRLDYIHSGISMISLQRFHDEAAIQQCH